MPFYCETEDFEPLLQLELVDLEAEDTKKDKFKEGSLVQFYNFLLEENDSKIKDLEHSLLYMKLAKSKRRGSLSDQRLRDILFIQHTKLQPQLNIF
ncbi:hypothetical protein PR048_022663 [Dryococelus australis]|uniref:Uncharacterized protein n=1 Tax=Dryococelus australis TaxID=614101 RepID=A0ABQ9H1N9_9NEOP|nr:hypothetical protein PR048_022663 [Dryococelus australis]